MIPFLFSRCGFLFAFLFFIGAIPGRTAMTEEEHQKRTAEIEAFVRTDLDKFEKALALTPPDVSVRDLSHAALAYLMLGEGPDKGVAKAEDALEHFFKAQNMDEKSPDFGTVPWSLNNPNIHDENAIEFTSYPLAALFILYADRFPKSFIDEARPHLHAAAIAVFHHNVKVAYTNIALMKLTNQILLGEYLNDADTLGKGKALLEEWMAYTKENGIHEFDSPTYSQTQLNDLTTLYHNVRDPDVKAKAKVILDYLWTDLAANFYAGTRSLCGPNSRTYDFLTHDYNLSQLYYLNGLPAEISTERVYLNDQVQIWASAVWHDYTPPDEAIALGSEPTRLIRQRYGPLPGEDRANYITPDFTLGSSSHFYGPQDREVVATLASEKKDLPFISIVADGVDAPYGKVKKVDKGGHSKIHHLEQTVISAVQKNGEVLALLDLAPGIEKEPMTSVATNVIFPLNANSVTVDGKPVNWGTSGVVPLTNRSVVCVREGKGAIAFRIFMADAVPGQSPGFFLKNDGKEWGAARLVAYQYKGAEKKLAVHPLRSGVLLLANQCASDAEFQNFVKAAMAFAITQTKEGNVWKVTAEEGNDSELGKKISNRLEASIDLSTHQTGPRTADGAEIVSPILTINDVDWASRIWAELPVTGDTPVTPKQD